MKFILGALFVFTLVLWGLWISQREEGVPPRGPVVAVAPAAGSGDLRIDLWINANRIDLNESVPFTLTVQNPNAWKVTGVKIVRFSHDGFSEPNDGCWQQGRPICTEAGPKLKGATEIPELGSLQIVGTLDATDSGRSVIGALLSWNSAAGPRSKAVTSVPVTIERPYAAISRATRLFMKDLGWPLALAILGYLFKKAEETQTRTRETWSVMFQLSHTRAEKYWMPLSATFYRLAAAYEAGDFDMAFFSLVRLWRQMVNIQREIGGFFLKTHITEDLLSSIWNVIAIWSNLVFGHAREEAALALKTTAMSYSDFAKKYASQPVFTRLRTIHDGQSSNVFQLIATLAALMEQVLDFEMNRPYANWYEDGSASFDIQAFDDAAATFESVRQHFISHSLPLVSASSMQRLRDAMAEVAKGIQRYRTFVVGDQRKQYLGKVFAM
jgi:hypothetical protein